MNEKTNPVYFPSSKKFDPWNIWSLLSEISGIQKIVIKNKMKEIFFPQVSKFKSIVLEQSF